MLAADLGGGLATGFLLLLYLLGRLEVGPLYLVSALTGALSSLCWPALSAMLEKRDYARASLERSSLLGLQLMFFGINFLTTPRSLYESFLSYVGVTFPLLPWGQPVRG